MYKDMLEILNNYEQAKMFAEDYAEEERLNHFYLLPECFENEKLREKLGLRLAEIKYLELLDDKMVFKYMAPVLLKDINFENRTISDEHMEIIERH